jgi:hypothetical protein
LVQDGSDPLLMATVEHPKTLGITLKATLHQQIILQVKWLIG